MASPSSTDRRRRRARRRARFALGAGALVVVVAGALAWAASPFVAEPRALASARALAGLEVVETAEAVVLAPADPGPTGLVVIAGARVEPAAYAWKLSAAAEAGIPVVIARPTLGFAIADTRSLAELTAPGAAAGVTGVERWIVGGHSLGGVRACALAADPASEAVGLLLLGAYCADDLADSELPVLTLAAERDGLSTPAKIADAAHLLPASARLVELPGAVHAQFGDYGSQPGDGVPTAGDDEVREEIGDAVIAFAGALG
ncbi:alpha/beta hydrolase [Homoserinibacter sp. YIM 151385]|uniref:alpha/beta hydrolase n=1 Tax=Homoserinibacter sp. YIM 151385 TaxID=2985506 RepID=UPI0022F0933D|nr:alpha/beta hydrolase [Homoserinibacter sp. YIM 151385]WBU37828.1 alpha/beta hydrolase [Homoserinibacter sp. YIM 151385]